MNDDLSLLLELLEQSASHFQFRLTIQSRGSTKLIVPFPEIIGIRFRSAVGGRESEWFTSLLVSDDGGGFTLEPGSSRAFEWRVRPRDIARPRSESPAEYYRWCVDVPPGEYQVAYYLEVDSNYFDPDSHMRLPDLERIAHAQGATVWLGQTESNSLSVIRQGVTAEAHD